ncbi:Na+/H+ antiporter [Leptolyngbya sp. AN02str]|uniref:Na+/H+ antiporter n=1 Tax=Leptolyngbya sp. AN02str TaxID=3423363 RepID=UPI003D3131B9
MLESAASEEVIELGLKQFVLALSVALSVTALTQLIGRLRQVPYTLVLVMVGLALAFVDIRLVELSPELILLIFLPPLLFEASWNLKWGELKRQLIPVCLLAVFGVVIAVLGIAFGLHQVAGLSLTSALLIGASLAATDPVSVTALFRELGIGGSRLSTLTEGESLFNDGMAVVAFGFLVGLPLGTATLSVQSVLLQLVTVVGIGIAVGGVVGFGISYLTQRFDLPLVEQSLTLVATYATYLITEDLGGSGVIAVVVAGLVLGNYGSRIGMNPRTRVIVSEFWDFLAFFINSIVFLLVGDQIRYEGLLDNLGLIGVTVLSMLLARAIATFVLCFLSDRMTQSQIPIREQTVLWWGGVRGTVSIALALSVPVVLPEREDIISIVFGAVLFTLLVQGLTVKPMMIKLNLLDDQLVREEYLELAARQFALNRVLERLQSDKQPDIDPEFYRYQEALVKGEIDQTQTKIDKLKGEHPNLVSFIVEQFQEELMEVEANAYAELVKLGRLKEELSPTLEAALQEEGNQA